MLNLLFLIKKQIFRQVLYHLAGNVNLNRKEVVKKVVKLLLNYRNVFWGSFNNCLIEIK